MDSGGKVIYLQGLNGLRAIAALSVVASHISMPIFGDFGLPELFKIPTAEFGVTMFFVISGFLITYLLILERNKINTVSIRKFYIRRILRIWPIYYLYIFLVLITALNTVYSQDILTSNKFYWYMFFTANIPFIQSTAISYLAHYWSIGVEEQFYLFWPWIFKYSISKLLYISIGLLVAILIVKFTLWLTFGAGSSYYRFFSVSRFHCMMVGAIGAILYERKSQFISYIDCKYIQYITWICMVLMCISIIRFPAPIAHEVFAVLSSFIIIGQINIKNRIVNLESNIMNFLGNISYGIYVIHPLVILFATLLLSNLETSLPYKYIIAYLVVIGLTICFAYISYTYYESYFLNMKKKFAVVKSTASH